MWQRGLRFGVVGFDRVKHDIYFASPSAEAQHVYLESIQMLSAQERTVNALVFLADVAYFETSSATVKIHNTRNNRFFSL